MAEPLDGGAHAALAGGADAGGVGLPGDGVTSPYGLVAPAGLEPGVLRSLHDGLKAALFDQQHQAALERYDMRTEYLDSADYARFMAETIDMEEKRVDRLGLRGT